MSKPSIPRRTPGGTISGTPSPRHSPGDKSYQDAMQRHRAGDLTGAEAACRRLLAKQPTHCGALQMIGVICGQRQDFEQALRWFDKALAIDNRSPALQHNRFHMMGVICGHRHDYTKALDWFDKALAIDNRNAAVHHNRSAVLKALRRNQEALAASECALRLMPTHAPAWRERAHLLRVLHRYEESVQCFDVLLRAATSDNGIPPPTREVHEELLMERGAALAASGRRAEAAQSYRQALELGYDRDIVAFRLAALGEQAVPQAAPKSHVRNLFDHYAADFDSHLVNGLGYRTPWRLVEALAGLTAERPLDTLDLGCGTGLCGPLLRHRASRLVGVDLSQKMLDKASTLAVYDELHCAELSEYLAGIEEGFDVVVAADVLVYIGDLALTMAGVRRALRASGYFAFSTESEEGDVDFVLRPSLRYAHRRGYVEGLAAEHGLRCRSFEAGELRLEAGAPISGYYVVLQRV